MAATRRLPAARRATPAPRWGSVFLVAARTDVADWRSPLLFVQPETVIRWHRTAWRRYWTWKSRKQGPGRPRIDPALRQLIHRLARENPRWGVVRIVGELRSLGYEVSARTVRRYRQRALRRPPSQSWRTFLHNHTSAIWAVDLFTVQTLTLRTVYALVFIAHGRRRIVHVNVTRHPTAQWIWRQVIEATPWAHSPGISSATTTDVTARTSFNARRGSGSPRS
jgi:putative transposase